VAPATAAPPAPGAAPGLTSAQAADRLRSAGPNVLAAARPPHWVRRFLRNFTHLFALLLWAGAVLAWVGGMPELAAAVVAVIFVNAVFSFAQEFRAERAVDALGRILPHLVRVRRDGRAVEVPSEDVVPGDLVLLAPGDRVPADGRLAAAVELRLDESTLTGESKLVHRAPGEAVFAGTYVVAGIGQAVVGATGMQTELGRITTLTQATALRESPLEIEMDRVTRLVAVLSVSLGTAFFLLAGLIGMDLEERFLFAIGVTVANVPEGLLPTVTLSLALATQRMARRNAIVRRLSAVETLGETTVICTDKTGTLTANQMTVRTVWTPEGELAVEGTGYAPEGALRPRRGTIATAEVTRLARAAALCTDAHLRHSAAGWTLVGDPTEGALLTLALKAGVDPEAELERQPRLHLLPFDSVRKRMTSVHATGAGPVAYVKGAPDSVIPRCTLAGPQAAAAHTAAEALARDGLRVLAIAERPDAPDSVDVERVESGLRLLGLVGMEDPPRPEVAGAIAACRRAGMRVVMVTGDHPVTAQAIGWRTGVLEGPAHVLEGKALDALSDAELTERLEQPGVVVARVTPEQKLRIATVLREAGEVVAMTGDGVNDAPALRAADIGIAMGLGGTDVAREAADVVLVDDNFTSIAAAVEEGRAVYDNIRRFAQYHFSSNVAELMAFLVWGVSGGAIPLPLVVMQVLAIDLGTDLLPAIALGTERPEPGTMQRPPRPRTAHLLDVKALRRVYGYVGLWVGVGALTAFFAAYWLDGWRPFDSLADSGHDYVQATAMTYAGIVMGQVGASFAFRTDRDSVFSVGLFSNRLLLAGIAVSLTLLVAILHLPPLQRIFHTEAPDPQAWLLLAVLPVVVLAAEETRKAVVRRRAQPGSGSA
jgi:P-type Ca2+ transporter type 2C